jgi:hypothetical protein
MPPQINITRIALTALAVLGFASYAQAATLTLDNCDLDGCRGSTLSLSVEAAGDGFDVIYTIDTTNYTGAGVRSGFNQIGFKAIQGWTSGTVDVAPAGWVTGSSSNAIIPSNIKANSHCEGSSNNDFACIYGFVNIVDNPGEYTWNFHFVGGTLMTDTSEWNLSGQYADGGARTPGWIISASSAPIPEPTAALLFGLGAILVTRRAQRR